MIDLRMRRADARSAAMPALERARRLRRRATKSVDEEERFLEDRMFHLVACGHGASDPALREDLRALAAALLPGPRTWLAAALTDADIGNGGLWQFFGNSTGDLTPFAITALRDIGSPARAELVERAARALFGTSDVPLHAERLEILDRRPQDDATGAIVDALDDAYITIATEAPIDPLLRAFALPRAAEFFLD
jgi:hypothetical protein